MNRDALFAVSISIIASILYFATRSVSLTGDSLCYAAAVKDGIDLFHPHHLIFSPVVYAFRWTLISFGLSPDAVLSAQILNSISGGFLCALVYLLMRGMDWDRRAAFLGASFVMISNGVWSFATQVEVYVTSTAFLLLAILFWTKIEQSDRNLVWKMFGCAVSLSLAILYHQSIVIFPVALLITVLISRNRRLRDRALIVVLTAALFCIIAYIAAYVSVGENPSLHGLVGWTIKYASYSIPSWGTFAHFGIAGISLGVKSQVRDIVTMPSGSGPLVLASVLIFFVIEWIAIGFQFVRSMTKVQHESLRLLICVWLVCHFIFAVWWLPGENEFFVSSTPLALILIFLTARDLRLLERIPRSSAGVSIGISALLIIIIAGINLEANIVPHMKIDEERYALADSINSKIESDCLILTDYVTQQYLSYYFNRRNTRELPRLTQYLELYDSLPTELRVDSRATLAIQINPVKGLMNQRFSESVSDTQAVCQLLDLLTGREAISNSVDRWRLVWIQVTDTTDFVRAIAR